MTRPASSATNADDAAQSSRRRALVAASTQHPLASSLVTDAYAGGGNVKEALLSQRPARLAGDRHPGQHGTHGLPDCWGWR